VIVLDTSAVVAVLQDEPERRATDQHGMTDQPATRTTALAKPASPPPATETVFAPR
jgi:hypothetical protein